MYFSGMRNLLVALIGLFSLTSVSAQVDPNIAAIRKILFTQVVAWNSGDVDGYMKGYWESDSLVFIGSNGPNFGYKATLNRYKEHYPDAAHMGHLKTSIVSMEKLSDEYYFVIGKWALTRTAGNVDGSFTLLFRKIKGKWVIVCDHSS